MDGLFPRTDGQTGKKENGKKFSSPMDTPWEFQKSFKFSGEYFRLIRLKEQWRVDAVWIRVNGSWLK